LPKFSESADITVTLANGTTIHRVAEHVRAWIAGSDTEFNPADDVIETTGKIIVSVSNGNEYSKIITTPFDKNRRLQVHFKGCN